MKLQMSSYRKIFLFLLILTSGIFILHDQFFILDGNSQITSKNVCDPYIDKDGNGIPDDHIPKKNIDWSYCNLEGINFSKLTDFDFNESERPFTGDGRYHTSKYAEPIRDGIPNDAHEFRQHMKLSFLDYYTEVFYSFFGIDYDIDDYLYTGANFENANFTHANFKNTNLIDSKLKFANLNSVDFSNSLLMGVNFEHTDLNNANFKNANLQHAGFYRANLKDVNFDGADLSYAYLYEYENNNNVALRNFSNSILKYTLMENATLTHANFLNAEINETEFFLANLSNTDLSKSKFVSGNFSHTNLSNADLRGLDLSTSTFVGANLSGANLSGAVIDKNVESEIDLSCDQFYCTDLKAVENPPTIIFSLQLDDADLVGMNLSGADLSGTNLSGADLSGTNLSGADLSGTNLSG